MCWNRDGAAGPERVPPLAYRKGRSLAAALQPLASRGFPPAGTNAPAACSCRALAFTPAAIRRRQTPLRSRGSGQFNRTGTASDAASGRAWRMALARAHV